MLNLSKFFKFNKIKRNIFLFFVNSSPTYGQIVQPKLKGSHDSGIANNPDQDDIDNQEYDEELDEEYNLSNEKYNLN